MNLELFLPEKELSSTIPFVKMHSNSAISIFLFLKKSPCPFLPLFQMALYMQMWPIPSVYPDLSLLSYLLPLDLPVICDFWTLIVKSKHIFSDLYSLFSVFSFIQSLLHLSLFYITDDTQTVTEIQNSVSQPGEANIYKRSTTSDCSFRKSRWHWRPRIIPPPAHQTVYKQHFFRQSQSTSGTWPLRISVHLLLWITW